MKKHPVFHSPLAFFLPSLERAREARAGKRACIGNRIQRFSAALEEKSREEEKEEEGEVEEGGDQLTEEPFY